MIKRFLVFAVSYSIMSSTVLASDSLNVISKKVGFGFSPNNNRNINSVIVHSTFNNSGGDKYDIDLVIKQFSNYGVSAHYVIGREGKIYQLVDEKDNSYHAGKSSLPDGTTNVNSCSIGIEIMTSYTESPTPAQNQALVSLIQAIQKRYPIKYVLRHSDIAPVRKTDPWNFDWEAFKTQLENKRN
ncbi:MAG: N-acetylmuramyl-L-alanine amidase, negative regulator of AmpC, AmpD [Bacteroidota bacterium]|jgi:N-acetyl-anhydromuramyl-L-alanine amidase AmpD|nr:N-acetylmuramyl-L-alanine amidase, negative regulator of AmpC, AmpD [Bacteroidota bacterium]